MNLSFKYNTFQCNDSRECCPPNFRGRISSNIFHNILHSKKEAAGDSYMSENSIQKQESFLSDKEIERINEALQLRMPDTYGAGADFYNIKKYGIKKAARDDLDVLRRESAALKYLTSNGVANIPKTKGIFFDDSEACLVTDIKGGISPGVDMGILLSGENVENLFRIFFNMDKALFSHGDLHSGNILIDGDKANLIDFGDYFVVGDFGELIEANEANFRQNITLSPKKRLQKLISKAARGDKAMGLDFSDNPNLPFNFSVSNFEYRFLSRYLKEYENVDSKGAKRFYADYLRKKGEYYKKRAEYYEKMMDGFGNSVGKNYLRGAILYDMASQNVLKTNPGAVFSIERAKMDFKALLYEAKNKSAGRHGDKSFDEYNERQQDGRMGFDSGVKSVLMMQYKALMDEINYILEYSKDNDMLLYAESLNKIYSNPYWMWEIENL